MYDVINHRHGWHARVSLTEGAREELLFWKDSIGSFNGQPIWFSAGATRMAFSDASDTGYGGYVVELGNRSIPWFMVKSRGFLEFNLERA